MGIHAGEAQERDGNYFGATVNRTARLMAAGHGGQIVLSGAVAELVRDRVSLRDLGWHDLRDVSALSRCGRSWPQDWPSPSRPYGR